MNHQPPPHDYPQHSGILSNRHEGHDDHAYLDAHFVFFLWGLSLGSLITLLQVAVSEQVGSAIDLVATVQSSISKLSIVMVAFIAG